MAATQPARVCTHIKPSGVRCGCPALRKEIFCYFHQRMIRGVRTPPKSRLHPIAILDDEKAIQASLMEIINALVRNTIDHRRAQLILRALHMAIKNSRHAHFDTVAHRMVDEVPEYPAPPEPLTNKQVAATQTPQLPQDQDKLDDEQAWDWDEIRRKIRENTYYEPPRKRAASPAPAPPSMAATESKPPESAKLPPQQTSSFQELAAKLLSGMSPP
jgi:hypothetical protein